MINELALSSAKTLVSGATKKPVPVATAAAPNLGAVGVVVVGEGVEVENEEVEGVEVESEEVESVEVVVLAVGVVVVAGAPPENIDWRSEATCVDLLFCRG